MRSWALAGVTAATALLHAVRAQPVPLPNTPDGFWSSGNADAQVTLDGFVDLLCPDCLAAHPVIQQVIAHYTPAQLKVTYHLFPLPYHTWAFTAAYAGNVITSLNTSSDAALAWLNYMYSGGQYIFYADSPTVAGLNSTQVAELFAQAAYNATGVNQAAFLNGLQNPNLNENTRISWKYACSRSVTGTPSFFVNDLPVAADSTWTLAQWTQLLDPLFNSSTRSVAARGGKGQAGMCGRGRC